MMKCMNFQKNLTFNKPLKIFSVYTYIYIYIYIYYRLSEKACDMTG